MTSFLLVRGSLSLVALLGGLYTFKQGLAIVLEAPNGVRSELSIFGAHVTTESIGVAVMVLTIAWLWAAVKLAPKSWKSSSTKNDGTKSRTREDFMEMMHH